jgi:hypothetical protein
MIKKYKHLRPIYPIKYKSKNPGFQPVTFDCQEKGNISASQFDEFSSAMSGSS